MARPKGIPAWNKGIKHSQKHKEKLKKAWLKRKENGLGEPWNKGKKLSPEHAQKVRLARIGAKHTEEWKKQAKERMLGKKNPLWKKTPSYRAIHQWVDRKKGKAKEHKCSFCGERAYDWANIDHKYNRNKKDYIPLCKKCHMRFDK